MNTLIVILIICVICFYVNIYLKPRDKFEIIQTNLSNFQEYVIYEKYPFLIFDNVVKMRDIINSIFKYQYIFSKQFNQHIFPTKSLFKTKSKYALLYNESEKEKDVVVKITTPKKSHMYRSITESSYYDKLVFHDTSMFDNNSVSIILKPYNILVLPAFWIFQIPSNKLTVFYLSDFMHMFFTNAVSYKF